MFIVRRSNFWASSFSFQNINELFKYVKAHIHIRDSYTIKNYSLILYYLEFNNLNMNILLFWESSFYDFSWPIWETNSTHNPQKALNTLLAKLDEQSCLYNYKTVKNNEPVAAFVINNTSVQSKKASSSSLLGKILGTENIS